jgi:predicted ATPase/class 3 adenylate cyclase/DNA-binding winged helix-turn-helix (wHTH) protein
VEVRLLGPLEVRFEDGPVDLGPRKQRAVLAMLALEAGRTVSADRLAEGLWGERLPQSAAKMVQLYVSHLRRVLDGDRARIVTRGRGYELQLADGEVDAVRAERLLEESRARDALALWQGEPLADLADEPFAAAEIRRLQELRLRAAELAIDADLSAGRQAELIGELDALVAANPLRERLHAQRMLALYRANRQAEALEAYRAARAGLIEQIGVEPGAELRRLHEQILAHDPALDLPAAAAPEAATGIEADLPGGTFTFLFSDIEGSTRPLAQLGERYADVLLEHRRALRVAFDAHGGREVHAEGDGFFIAFARASDAIAAAVSAQHALARHEWPHGITVRVRMGVHTGEAAVWQGSYVGLAVHRAARICSAGHGGQILISGATHALLRHDLPPDVALRDLGRHRLKDIDDPEHLFQLVAGDLPADFPPVAATAVSPVGPVGAGMLPRAPNRTIGREEEVRQIALQIRTGAERLLTLTGPGGVGKTRLALEAARAAETDFEHGARFISLAGARGADEVPTAVVNQLAIVPLAGEAGQDAVERFLADKRVLLVLDNAEHVLPAAAAVVAGLIASCRAVTVLATSRAPLSLAGERCWPVAPLKLPDGDADAARASPASAVELFAERVRARDPAFQLDQNTMGPVADICRQVDGLPLGIELAAARCGLLSPAEMAERLGAALTPLGEGPRDAPARQRTLRATIDWSYQLLTETERRCFVRFAAFRGGATIAAAEDVTDADLETLEPLVAQSLLTRRAGEAGTRLVMLETIRAYAADRLDQSSERNAVHERHYRHFLALATRHASERAVMGRAHREHLERLDADVDNLHAALEWAMDRRNAERALGLVAALGEYWNVRSRYAYAVEQCDAALALAGADAYPALRVRVLMRRAHSLTPLGGGLGLPETEEAESIARALGDPLLLSEALRFRADRETIANRPHVAARYADEALSLATAAEDPWAIAYAAHMKATAVTTIDELRERVPRAASLLDEVGHVFGVAGLLMRATYLALELGSVTDAKAFGDRALAVTRELDDPFDLMMVQTNVGLVALLDGDSDTARGAVRQALKLSRELAVPLDAAEALRVLAAVAVIGDDLGRAARLFGAATTHTYEPVDDDVHARLDTIFFRPAKSRYGEAAWDAAGTEGAALSLSDAIAYALEEAHPPENLG